MKLRSFIALIALSVIALPLLGHHAGFFDPNRVVEVSGTVARFEWTNPHAFLFIDIEKDDGRLRDDPPISSPEPDGPAKP